MRLASEILANFGSAAAQAVPALIQSMAKPGGQRPWANPVVGAAKALGRIGPKTAMADKAMSALVEVLQVGDSDVKTGAIEALAQFGPSATTAAPMLNSILEEARATKNDRLAILCAATMLKIGPPSAAASALRILRELAEQGTPDIRSLAASTPDAVKASK
jgi:hypothetical protein